MSEHDVVEATDELVTEESIVADLRTLGVREGAILLVHSSLKAIGWVSGGSHAVVRALLASLGPDDTLVMPACSSALSDPALWENPPVPQTWWQTIRDSMPPFDTRITPTSGVGAIPELFRSWPGSLRSDHPTCSFAAVGPRAQDILAQHCLQDPFGEQSPLAALYKLDAHILLLGVGFESCSSLHLAERLALTTRQKLIPGGAPLLVEGKRRWVRFEEPEVCSDDFPALGDAFCQDHARFASGNVGAASAKLVPMRPLVDFGVSWLSQFRKTD